MAYLQSAGTHDDGDDRKTSFPMRQAYRQSLSFLDELIEPGKGQIGIGRNHSTAV